MDHEIHFALPAHALGWAEALLQLMQLLPATLTIDTGWVLALLTALWLWRDRQRR